MTSTISLNKINSVIKKNFRLNSASFIVTNLLALIGTFLISYIIIGVEEKANPAQYVYDATQEFSAATAVLLSLIMAVELFFLSIKMFKEIYSRRASDLFYSMPVTRREYYTANVFYGLINILSLSAVVIIASLVFAKTSVFFDAEHNMVELSLFFNVIISCILGLIFEFSVFMFAAVLCGKIWQVVAVSVLISSSYSMLVSGITVYMNSIYGFYTESAYGDIGLNSLLVLLNNGNEVSDIAVTICYLIATAVIFAVGYLVFKNRKAETAEQSLSGRIMPYVILSLICAGIYISMSTAGDTLLLEIIYGIIACIVTAVIFCAVFYKKAFTKSAAISAAVVCVIMSAFVICTDKLPEKVGYVDYVPEVGEVQSVTYEVSGDNYQYAGDSSTTVIDSLFYSDDFYSEQDILWNIESKEGIENIIALHKKAVSDDIINKYNNYFTIEDPFDEDYIDMWYSFKLTYTLNNGKTVTRCYAVDCKDILEEYGAVIQQDEVINQRSPFTLDADSILFARVEGTDTEAIDEGYVFSEADDYFESDDYGIYYSEESYFTLESYDDFFELLRQDIKASGCFDAAVQDTGYSYYIANDKYLKNEQRICVYYLSEDCPAEMAEKFRKMTPNQVERHIYETYDEHILTDYIILNSDSDKNTIGFLNDKGILK